MNLKQWYINYGPAIMLTGILLYASSYIAGYVYGTINDIDAFVSPSLPFVFIALIGMLLICIGGLSLLFIFSEYDGSNQ